MSTKSIEELRELVKSTKGKFATMEFIKANGELRKMRFRTGVKKFVNPNARVCANGTTNTTAHIPKYMDVYDVEADGMRKINLETLKSVRCGKIQYDAD